jgi:uncharacterized repeat protein (TIGR03806 family)
MHLDHQRPGFPWPGGPVTRDQTPHDCQHPALPEIQLEAPLPLPPVESPVPTEACGFSGSGVNWSAIDADCPKLSDYRLTGDAGIPYDLTTPLFSDYAEKERRVYLPPGRAAAYRESGVLEFPVGTVISKTFRFGGRPLETRLLIRRERGWTGLPYLWDADGKEAHLALGGSIQKVTVTTESGKTERTDYEVPGRSKCASCHEGTGSFSPIGLQAKYLNRAFQYGSTGEMNQLEFWTRAGALTGAPADPELAPRTPVWNDPATGSLQDRAKAYLDINCAHCHNPTGRAGSTGLFLEFERDPSTSAFGRCKPPVAAGLGSGGRAYDIVPGDEDDSILPYRLESTHLAVRMPEVGRSIEHQAGTKLIKEWIDSMPKSDCKVKRP